MSKTTNQSLQELYNDRHDSSPGLSEPSRRPKWPIVIFLIVIFLLLIITSLITGLAVFL